jgi:ABC-type lipoprotein export system ATPase subunit
MPDMEFIELHDICKTYHLGELDLPVLRGVSQQVAQSEFVALMGVSGSGKSTLMNIMGCLDHPTSGEYWLDGREISRLTAKERARLRNRMIGFVFQSFNLLPRMTAFENVVMPLMYSRDNLTEHDMELRAAELIEKVGLSGRLHHRPSQLSGGEQQRVAIARSLIGRPQVLFADEPTGNLDSRTSEEILDLFQQLNHTDRITLIMVTHDPGVAQYAQRIIRIRDGLIDSGATPSRPGDAP